jgi:acyl carrier protein phosphodiesterase
VNYLAHFHLARGNDNWIAGALLGDFVKGPLSSALPGPLREGIQLHRHIDAFSDAHPLRAQFAKTLPAEYRRYAGIMLDVCCDYWLSRHWSKFETQALGAFAARIYAVLQANSAQMPAPAARMTQRLIEHEVLTRYNDVTVVAATLDRIGWRLRRDNPLRHLDAEFERYLRGAEPIFSELYPQLLARVDETFSAE